jgi:hypothetical protein
MGADSYATTASDPTGTGWVVKVRRSNAPGVYFSTATFEVRADADITRVSATNAPTTNSNVDVTAVAINHAASAIINSTMTYIIWWDENGDGVFNSGDTYVDSAGVPHSWNGVTTVSTHITAGVDVAGTSTWTQPPWSVNNGQFPHQGNYNVTATWTQSNGMVISSKTGQFFSIPALGWPIFALFLAFAGLIVWRTGVFDSAVSPQW